MSNDFIDAGPIENFRKDRGTVVKIDHVDVAVFRLKEGWFALKDSCPHQGASLADGELSPGMVTCRWHGWSFNLKDGESSSKRRACAKVYDLKIDNNHVWLKPPSDKDPSHNDDDDDWMKADPDTWFK